MFFLGLTLWSILFSHAAATGRSTGTWGSAKGLFQVGSVATYDLVNTVLLGEPAYIGAGSDVGYQISAKAKIATLWADPGQPQRRLISIQVIKQITDTSRYRSIYSLLTAQRCRSETEKKKYFIESFQFGFVTVLKNITPLET